jgi:hypothetical protein
LPPQVVRSRAELYRPLWNVTVKPLHWRHWRITWLPGSVSWRDHAYALGQFERPLDRHVGLAGHVGLVEAEQGGAPRLRLVQLGVGH